jgi:cell division protein FtsQ
MKFAKRGSAVLEAPEEGYASETNWPNREPAPAGMLQRGRLAADPNENPGSPNYAPTVEEEVYKPRRESMSYRLRLGVPKSLAGKIIFAAVALLGLGAIVIGYLGVRNALFHDGRFVVATASDIQIVGNQHLTRDQVLDIFGADIERNIFRIPLAERRADLERLPWVAHATVMRLLPNGIRVSITERVPVAFVRQGTQIGFVDAEGVLLDMPQDAAGDPRYSFPVLTGLSADDPLSARAARMEVYKRFMKDLDSSGEHLTQALSEVDLSNPEDVKALIPSGSTDILVHFGDEDFLNRYRLFEQNLPQWKTQYPKLASVDARYEHQFVLEMESGAAVPLASNGAPLPAVPAKPATPTAKPATAAAKPPVAKHPDTPKAAPKAAVKPATKPVAKPAKPKAKPVKHPADKLQSSNQKMFAALAAAHKAAVANAHNGAAAHATGKQVTQ